MDINLKDIEVAITSARTKEELSSIEKSYLSREGGVITLALQSLGKLPIEARKEEGKRLNELKVSILEMIKVRSAMIEEIEIENSVKKEKLDVTASARYISDLKSSGSIHPVTKTINELGEILNEEGYAVFTGYDIEDSKSNFTKLNTGLLHPSRQNQDTIYVDATTVDFSKIEEGYFDLSDEKDDDLLLRTHTSAQQIRIANQIIEKLKSEGVDELSYEFKYATLGRTYRNESDSTHSPMFHQMEIVCVSRNLFAQDLIDCVYMILGKFFNLNLADLKIRLRPSYFPFTVPSWEVDLFLPSKNEYVEILGCGMIHPRVLENMGLNSKIYTGYALGSGIERMCMLKYGIKDLRPMFGSDLAWLKHQVA